MLVLRQQVLDRTLTGTEEEDIAASVGVAILDGDGIWSIYHCEEFERLKS